MIRDNVYLVVDSSTNLITNIIVADAQFAKEMGFYPEYEGSAIGLEYNPPKPEEEINPDEDTVKYINSNMSNALVDGIDLV